MSEIASLTARYQANAEGTRTQLADLRAMIYQDILENLRDMEKTGIHIPTLLRAVLEEVEGEKG